jgi:hypothetical protein
VLVFVAFLAFSLWMVRRVSGAPDD